MDRQTRSRFFDAILFYEFEIYLGETNDGRSSDEKMYS